ncbi:MAG TPA: hypothetical protein VE007_04080 [Thermoanaerobaculia bacterium]|nr:hypothetical protein [Thermoanaerobaculia bacterium]
MDGLEGVSTGSGVAAAVGGGVGDGTGETWAAGRALPFELRHVAHAKSEAAIAAPTKSALFTGVALFSWTNQQHFPCLRYGATDQ